MSLLKLSAFDAKDLEIVSAHLQDALLSVGDIVYLPGERRFAFTAARITSESGGMSAERRLAGVQFLGVDHVKSRRVRTGAKEAVLSLLAIGFIPADEPPSGQIDLIFSGDGQISLDVEYIEVQFEDLGPARPTRKRPDHNLDGEAF